MTPARSATSPTSALDCTGDIDELISLKPDALVHYGPTAARAKDNIRLISSFLRAGIDVVSTAMTPWVWPSMKQNPSHWVEPITQACEEGGASCFTTGIDPGFANDLFPMTLMGLCAEVRTVRALELLDYVNYTGDYEVEMGIGRPPEYQALLEHTDILVMSWGATVPMIAHAAGIDLDEITSTWEKWVTDVPIRPRRKASSTPVMSPLSGSRSTACTTARRGSSSSTSTASATMRRRTGREGRRTMCTAWRSTVRRPSRRRRRSASPTGVVVTPPRRDVWQRGYRALNAIPAVNELPPGWVTALDLPLIAGAGTIR